MRRLAAIALAIPLTLFPLAAFALPGDTLVMKHDPEKYSIVVSATKTSRNVNDVAGSAQVVSGSELRRRGSRTVADALQDLTGLDAGDGSDNGSRQPNIGLWGLKEFDALLVTVDGVPVGGPFNPSLVQIPVDDIERIEVLKGPQGSLYGVSAFAGAVNVITRGSAAPNQITVGGGSFGDLDARGSWHRRLPDGTEARVSVAGTRGDGWQDRTASALDRASASFDKTAGGTRLMLDVHGFRDDQHWGTPVAFDDNRVIRPGFEDFDRNYAVSGAHVEHRVFSGTLRSTTELPHALKLENTLGFARDDQTFLRSFPNAFDSTSAFGSEAIFLQPKETSAFDDARLVSRFAAGGAHELVTGASITWGHTNGDGSGRDFDVDTAAYPTDIPGLSAIPIGDQRSFEDSRTFIGLYAHDDWTPHARITLSGGGRFDHTDETLETHFTETGNPEVVTNDDQSNAAWSGDLGAVIRLTPKTWGDRGTVNLFGNWKSSFKPAAPNLTEAEAATILDPERTHSIEGGVRAGAFDEQVGLEFSMFQMDFHNLVVSNLDSLGNPELLNAGHERFKGYELTLRAAPTAIPGLSLSWGYAHHDARFVQFTFVDPDGNFLDVSGNRLEMTPQEMWNASGSYHHPSGATVWASVRHQGQRAYDRDNLVFAPGFSEWDAGASYEVRGLRFAIVGRNLGDDRHPVAESEIGDSEFYMSPPRRVRGEVTVHF